MKVWSIENGDLVLQLVGHQGAVYDLDFSPCGQLLATAATDETLRVWDLESGDCVHLWRGHQAPVTSCRFVDEVVPGVPYVMDDEYLSYVVRKYRIDYVVHGDDACVVNGRDVYASAKAAGKYRTIPRTDGVSSTDIVGRMLLMSTSTMSLSPAAPAALSLISARQQTCSVVRRFAMVCG